MFRLRFILYICAGSIFLKLHSSVCRAFCFLNPWITTLNKSFMWGSLKYEGDRIILLLVFVILFESNLYEYLHDFFISIFMSLYDFLHFHCWNYRLHREKLSFWASLLSCILSSFYAFHQPVIILTVFHFSQSRPRKQLPAYHWLGSSREWMVELINRHSYQQSPVPPLNCGCQPINSPLNFKHLGTIVSRVGAPWALFSRDN